MRSIIRNSKRAMSLFLALFFLSVLFLAATPITVLAADGEWIDKSVIRVGDVAYTDTNPYDGTNEWRATTGCSRITTNSNLQDAQIYFDSGTNQGCSRAETLNLANENERWVTAYKLADNTVFIVNGLTCDGGGNTLPTYSTSGTGGTDFGSTTYIRVQDLGGTYYRQLPADNPAAGSAEPGAFFRMGGNAPVNGQLTDRLTSGGQLQVTSCSPLLRGAPPTVIPGTGSAQVTMVYKNAGEIVNPPIYAPAPPPGVVFTSPDGTTTDGNQAQEAPTCEAGFEFSMSWLVCAFLGFVDSGLNKLQEQVMNLLVVNGNDYNNPVMVNGVEKYPLREAWSYFRNVASFLLVMIGLVMIIGQAIGRD